MCNQMCKILRTDLSLEQVTITSKTRFFFRWECLKHKQDFCKNRLVGQLLVSKFLDKINLEEEDTKLWIFGPILDHFYILLPV